MVSYGLLQTLGPGYLGTQCNEWHGCRGNQEGWSLRWLELFIALRPVEHAPRALFA